MTTQRYAYRRDLNDGRAEPTQMKARDAMYAVGSAVLCGKDIVDGYIDARPNGDRVSVVTVKTPDSATEYTYPLPTLVTD